MANRNVYLIGSLRNENVPVTAGLLRATGHTVFDDWYSAGPEADDYWQKYEKAKGNTLPQALKGYAAQHVFEFDKHHLNRCDTGVLLMPAGKSGHLEMGYMAGRGKETYIVFDKEPERFDVMLNFATDVFTNIEDLLARLNTTAKVEQFAPFKTQGSVQEA